MHNLAASSFKLAENPLISVRQNSCQPYKILPAVEPPQQGVDPPPLCSTKSEVECVKMKPDVEKMIDKIHSSIFLYSIARVTSEVLLW
jgi:hypothetical protein